MSSPIVDMIMDLTEAARPIDESYHCSAIEIDTCQDRCLAALAKELNVVRPAEPDRINWDAFKENQEAAKEVNNERERERDRRNSSFVERNDFRI